MCGVGFAAFIWTVFIPVLPSNHNPQACRRPSLFAANSRRLPAASTFTAPRPAGKSLAPARARARRCSPVDSLDTVGHGSSTRANSCSVSLARPSQSHRQRQTSPRRSRGSPRNISNTNTNSRSHTNRIWITSPSSTSSPPSLQRTRTATTTSSKWTYSLDPPFHVQIALPCTSKQQPQINARTRDTHIHRKMERKRVCWSLIMYTGCLLFRRSESGWIMPLHFYL